MSFTSRNRLLALLVCALTFVLVACAKGEVSVGAPGDDGGGGGPDGALTADGSTPGDGGPADGFTVGGTVTGLQGSGLVLQNNGGDDLPIGKDGGFTFATKLKAGAAFAVTIKTQPATPAQTCSVSGGAGTIGSGNVASVTINCAANKFTIGGTVTGLAGSGLVLQDNGGDDLLVNANGAFAFATPLDTGKTYAVTVKTQPSSVTQTCTVASGSGTVAGANVTSVAVDCATNSYTIGGTATGVAGSGLVLQDNGGDDLTISADGAFTFATPVASGASYAVTVKTQPSSPSQTCTVAGGSGKVGGANVTSVAVTCTTNTYTVGGTVSGLSAGTLVLQDNGADDLSLTQSGAFTFATPIASGATYAVTVKTQPGGGVYCTVSAGSGTIASANVTTVVVTCSSSNGTVTDVNGITNPAVFVPCGNGTNTNCTEAVAETSCTAIGKKLVSHASDGTNSVVSLGATTSCYWSISYFTNNDPAVAGQCLVGVSNAYWSGCCGTSSWHGNVVTVPTTLGQQFGYTSSNDTGYNSNLTNTSGTTWGCQALSSAPPSRAGCATYYVACK